MSHSKNGVFTLDKMFSEDRVFCSIVEKEAERLILSQPIPVLAHLRGLTPTHCIKILKFLSTKDDVLEYCVLLACLTDFVSCESYNLGLVNKSPAWSPGSSWFLWQLSEAWISIIPGSLIALPQPAVLALIRSFQFSFRLLEYYNLQHFFVPLHRLCLALEAELLTSKESELLNRLKIEANLRSLLNVFNSNFVDTSHKIVDDWLKLPFECSWLTSSLQYPYESIGSSKTSKNNRSWFSKFTKHTKKKASHITSYLSISSPKILPSQNSGHVDEALQLNKENNSSQGQTNTVFIDKTPQDLPDLQNKDEKTKPGDSMDIEIKDNNENSHNICYRNTCNGPLNVKVTVQRRDSTSFSDSSFNTFHMESPQRLMANGKVDAFKLLMASKGKTGKGKKSKLSACKKNCNVKL